MGEIVRMLFIIIVLVAAPILSFLSALQAEFLAPAYDLVLGFPVAFIVTAIFGYALIARLPEEPEDFVSIIAACIAAVVVFVIFYVIGFLILVSSMSAIKGGYLIFPFVFVVGLPACVIYSYVLKSEVPYIVEIPAMMALLLFTANVRLQLPLDGLSEEITFFTYWPALLGLVPAAFSLALYSSRELTAGYGAVVLLVSLAPFYFAVAAIDQYAGREMALIWPARIVADYENPEKRSKSRETFAEVRSREPFQIGRNIYEFDRLADVEVKPVPGLRAKGIGSVLFRVPLSELSIRSDGGRADKYTGVQLELKGLSREKIPTFRAYFVSAPYDDLMVTVERPRDAQHWPADEIVMERIRKMMDLAKVNSPAT